MRRHVRVEHRRGGSRLRRKGRERLGEALPPAGLVQRAPDRLHQGGHARAAGRVGEDAGEPRLRVAAGERALRAGRGAHREEPVQLLLLRPGDVGAHVHRLLLPARLPGGVRDQVERAVEGHRADLVLEQVRVGAAQVGAVGVAVEVQRGVAGGLAQQLQVARHVRRRKVGEQGAGPRRARPARCRARGEERVRLPQRRSGRRRVVRARAAHRCGPADPAWVEAHQIEPGTQLFGVARGEPGQLADAVGAGAAEVEEQRAEPSRRVARREPDHRERDRGALRLAVAQRHGRGRALEAAVARRPVQRRHGGAVRAERRGSIGGSRPGRGCGRGRRGTAGGEQEQDGGEERLHALNSASTASV